MNWKNLMTGWLDPKTKRATAFYALLGVTCSRIYHTGLDKYSLCALILLTGVGSLAGIAAALGNKAAE
jgi:hypothetical protein